MASMSYCMFENTATELNQVVNAMEEAMDWEDLDLNEYEMRAKTKLYNLCLSYIALYEKLDDASSEEVC